MYENEYNSLRAELNENKKYIFERPLLIITAAFVFFQYMSDSPFILLFPCIIFYLLLFNLEFTSNRLNSSARIVSYIRLKIETADPKNYRWETFLSEYRKVSAEKSLRYYPIIYWFHILSMVLFILIEYHCYLGNKIDFAFQDLKKEIITISSVILILIGLVFFLVVAARSHPKRIERFFINEQKTVLEALKHV